MKDIKHISSEDVSALFSSLDPNVNKGDMGRLLLICGSYDGNGSSMCGAAYFSGAAAYRCGAGIVEIFTARKNYEAIGSLLPEAVYSLYENEENEADVCTRLRDSIRRSSGVVIGCGLGKSEISKRLLITALSSDEIPLVIDADALNIMSEDESLWSLISSRRLSRTVITPHPGEMSRLVGLPLSAVLSDHVGAAESFSSARKVICLLKGHRTVITDGVDTYINESGNAGMATAGMGDVLSGMIGAILARRSLLHKGNNTHQARADELYSTAAAAYIHGVAGDVAAERLGEYSLMARDVISAIPSVIKSCK